MTKQQAWLVCQDKFGNVRLEERQWVLPTPGYAITMCYAIRPDGVIVAVGGSWDDLSK